MKKLLAILLSSTSVFAAPLFSANAQTRSVATPLGATSLAPVQDGSSVPGLGYYDPVARNWKLLPIHPSEVPLGSIAFFANNVGPNGVMRTPAQRFGEQINLLDFGVVSNGSIDQTTAIQNWVAAINAQGSVGTQGRLPCGTYSFSQTLVFTGSNDDVEGLGEGCTVLIYTGAGDAVRFSSVTGANPTGSGSGFNRFGHLTLRRNTPDSSSGIGVHVVNQTYFKTEDLNVVDFFTGVRQDGGQSNNFARLTVKSGELYSSFQTGSSSIDLEPFVYTSGGANIYSPPEGTYLSDFDLGGFSNYSIEAGVRIGAIDGFFSTTGHIGAVVNDIMLARTGNQSIASVEIAGGYLDGSQRAVYIPAPSTTQVAGNGNFHIRIHPYTIENQYGNGIEISDPSTDVGIGGVDFANQGTTGTAPLYSVYAPFVGKLQIYDNKFEGSGPGTGGIMVGIVSNGTLGQGTAGSAVALTEVGNQFYGVTGCLFSANTIESLISINQTNDCTSGKQPIGPAAATVFSSAQSGSSGLQFDTSGAAQISLAQGASQQLVPTNTSGLIILTYFNTGTTSLLTIGGGSVALVGGGGYFTATSSPTGGNFGVYYNSGTASYYIINNTGNPANIGVSGIRTRASN